MPSVFSRCVLSLVLILAGMNRALAIEGDYTVKQLAEDCDSDDKMLQLNCFSYFLGFSNALYASASLYGADIPICYPPDGVSAGDMILAFRLWSSTNPDMGENAAGSGILMALVQRFPCKPK